MHAKNKRVFLSFLRVTRGKRVPGRSMVSRAELIPAKIFHEDSGTAIAVLPQGYVHICFYYVLNQ